MRTTLPDGIIAFSIRKHIADFVVASHKKAGDAGHFRP
jgi:hypothetical protein